MIANRVRRYLSYDDISASPAAFMRFAECVVADAQAKKVDLQDHFSSGGVIVGDRPFSMLAQLSKLKSVSWVLEQMMPSDLDALHRADAMLRKADPAINILDHLQDRRIAQAVEKLARDEFAAAQSAKVSVHEIIAAARIKARLHSSR